MNTKVKSTPVPPQAPMRSAGELKEALSARRHSIGLALLGVVTVLLTAYVVFAPVDKLIIGFVVILLMLALMLFKIPVAVAMSVASFLGLFLLAGPRGLTGTLQDIVFSSFSSWSLSVIPMFVLMGVAMSKSGLMSGAFDAARKWLARLPGGLAIATNFAGAGMAATSGSSIGITYAVGRVSIPEMIRSGYKPSLAMGSTAMAGTLGQVVPPSILLVIYAGIAQTPVGPQLLAGVIPGLILALLFATVIILWASVSPKSAPRGPAFPWRERIAALIHLVPILIVVSVVLGGIYFGVFTATEAGAYGALATIILGSAAVVASARRRAPGSEAASPAKAVGSFLSTSLLETISSVASIFFMLIGVYLLTRVMALSRLAQWVSDGVVALGLNQLTFLFLLIPVYLVLGFFLDTLAMMLLTVPVFLAPLQALDVNLIWFGVFLIVLAEIDMVAPPLGILNFVVLTIAKIGMKGSGVSLTIGQVFRGVTPFIAACILFLFLLIAFPDIALWLPAISSVQ